MASNIGKIRRIAFDIGHGRGNRSAGVYDSGMNYIGPKDEHQAAEEFGEGVAKKVAANGHPTLVIEDKPVWLRDDIARGWKADYLISSHFNAGGGSGTEVWVPLLAGPAWVKKATLIGKGIADVCGVPWRGVKRSGSFAVLNFKPYSMIVEVVFGDNKSDVAKYESHKNGAMVAAAKGILYGIQDL